MIYKDPLLDKDFLKKLDESQHKEIYAKITSLIFATEEPIESIEGSVTTGSLSIDGSSSVRRSCSLTLTTKEVNINDFYWGLHSKFSLSIGLLNTVDPSYPDIIWFKQGVFIITSFSSSLTTNNYTISITGSDKMCLLNGTVGGVLTASVDFGKKEFVEYTYEEVSLGDSYTIGKYYTANETFSLATEDFDKNIAYYKRKKYQKVDLLVEDYEPNKYYMSVKPDYYIDSDNDLEIKHYQKLEIPIYNLQSLTFDLFVPGAYYEPIYKELDGTQNDDLVYFYKKDEEYYEPVSLRSETYTYSLYYYKENDKYILDTGSFNRSRQYFVKKQFVECAAEEASHYSDEFKISEDLLFDSTKNYYTKIEYQENEEGEYIYTSYILATEDGFQNDENYYILLENPIYEDIDLTSDTYEKNKYYFCNPSDFELSLEFFDKTQHYYQQNEDGTFTRVKFFSDNNYVIDEYYTYNPKTDSFSIAKDAYSPDIQYYRREVYDYKSDVPIKTIIKEAIHTYAEEPYYNIIINDLGDYGMELMEYRGDAPLYFLMEDDYCKNVTVNGKQPCYIVNVDDEDFNTYLNQLNAELTYFAKGDSEKINNYHQAFINNVTNGDLYTLEDLEYDVFIDDINDDDVSRIILEGDTGFNVYTVVKIEYGETAGYRRTDLVMENSAEFIFNVGDTLTSMLDGIKNMLADFEYFYDTDGHFVFQRNQSHFTHSWNNIIDTPTEQVESAAYSSAVQYNFEGNTLISSFNNNPNLNNLRNDFSVWGKRKGVTGIDLPIHARFAIDKKPTYYCAFPETRMNKETEQLEYVYETYNGIAYQVQYVYYSNEKYNQSEFIDTYTLGSSYGIHKIPICCDWREIIYQMAMDYYKHNQEEDFLVNVKNYNDNLYPQGYTGYEKYYIDIEGFWRGTEWRVALYNPTPEVSYEDKEGYYETYNVYNKYNQELESGWNDQNNLYTDLICQYYLPLSEKDKYEKLINQQEESLTKRLQEITIYYNSELEKSMLKSLEDKQNEILREIEENRLALNTLKTFVKENVSLSNESNQTKNLADSLNEIAHYEMEKQDLIDKFKEDCLNLGYDTAIQDKTYNDFDDLTELKTQVAEDLENEEDNTNEIIELLEEEKASLNQLLEEYELIKDNEDENVAELQQDILDLQEEIALLTNDLNDNEAYKMNQVIESFESKLSSLNETIETLKADITLNSEAVTNNETDMAEENEEVDAVAATYQDNIKVLQNEYRQYTLEINKINTHLNIIKKDLDILTEKLNSLTTSKDKFLDSNFSDKYMYWNKNFIEAPTTLDFWLEFLDTEGELSDFSIPKVGDRPKAVNDDKVTSIYFRDVPTVIFTTESEYDPLKIETGYTYVFYPEGMEDLFSISYQGKSAKEVIDELMYQFAYCVENVSLQTVPIYYLEPNNRIFIHDEETGISGEYLINRMTIPLSHNGMMSIEAVKAPIRLY